jgi:hypothetical protein
MASNISGPAFFRVIEEEQPTLLIDEADTFLHGNDELRGILNAGYYRPNAYVIRVSSEPRRAEAKADPLSNSGSPDAPSTTLARYSCWCPKVIAAIGHLPETLADRCIVIRMQRKRGDEECERLRNLDAPELRQRCQQFALEHQQSIAAAKATFPKPLNDRACDIWEPLLAIADIAGGHWPETARAAAVALTSGAQESSPSSTLLFDIWLSFTLREAERLFTHQLIEDLNSQRSAGRPWREGLKGKPVTEMWLAQQVRPFGMRPKAFRIGERVGKGYELSEMQDLFGRYLTEAEVVNWRAENLAKLQTSNETTNERE